MNANLDIKHQISCQGWSFGRVKQIINVDMNIYEETARNVYHRGTFIKITQTALKIKC